MVDQDATPFMSDAFYEMSGLTRQLVLPIGIW